MAFYTVTGNPFASGGSGGSAGYTAASAAVWTAPAPTTSTDALNRLAAAVQGLLGGPVPTLQTGPVTLTRSAFVTTADLTVTQTGGTVTSLSGWTPVSVIMGGASVSVTSGTLYPSATAGVWYAVSVDVADIMNPWFVRMVRLVFTRTGSTVTVRATDAGTLDGNGYSGAFASDGAQNDNWWSVRQVATLAESAGGAGQGVAAFTFTA